MKKAIGYIRISTKDQSNFSLEGQEKYIREYAERLQITISAIFKDDGKSATFRTKCNHCGASGDRTWVVSVKCTTRENPFTCRKCNKKSPITYQG